MGALEQLDRLNSQLAQHVFACAPMDDWVKTIATLAFTPDASVGSRSFHFHLTHGQIDKGSSPIRKEETAIGNLAERHWQLTQELGQPRWYKMIVTVERSGKFSVDFEYKDNYKEGDIMRDG